MDEEKIQRLHDTLSKLRKGKGLGTNSHYSWNAHESVPMKKNEDGTLYREDGLPVNGLYANFIKQGTYDPKKVKENSTSKYGDGRVIKRNFDDIDSDGDQDGKSKKKKSKEERKAEKKAAKIEAKKQAKMEGKKLLKLEAKRAAKKLEKAKKEDEADKSSDGIVTEAKKSKRTRDEDFGNEKEKKSKKKKKDKKSKS